VKRCCRCHLLVLVDRVLIRLVSIGHRDLTDFAWADAFANETTSEDAAMEARLPVLPEADQHPAAVDAALATSVASFVRTAESAVALFAAVDHAESVFCAVDVAAAIVESVGVSTFVL